ncbi:hypothetical protein ACVWXO_006634 [Bradyrhizobium sp. LM2.7]
MPGTASRSGSAMLSPDSPATAPSLRTAKPLAVIVLKWRPRAVYAVPLPVWSAPTTMVTGGMPSTARARNRAWSWASVPDGENTMSTRGESWR